MCGIVGILSKDKDVAPLLVEGLKRLEYRGYDSAGIATLQNGTLDRRSTEMISTQLTTVSCLSASSLPLPHRVYFCETYNGA